MPSKEERESFKRYKEDVSKRGKPFYPYAMFHDTVMSFVVVVVIVGLACVWRWTATGDDHVGWLGKLYDDPADSGTFNFVPRPDWYFFFLFYLLRIFKWPESVLLGTVGIPTILLMILIVLPFVDRRKERRILRRPVAVVAAALVALSMGVLTWKGATAKESLGAETLALVPQWAATQGFTDNKKAVAGARVFAQAGCLNCHTYLGAGGSNLGAPDLSDEGSKNKGIDFQVRHLKCPSCVNPGSPMPQFASFPDPILNQLATFLEASKGPK
jgi:menaquinol-cytochrome c reductase cytochrome b/c subunit